MIIANIEGLKFERTRGEEVVGLEDAFSMDGFVSFLELNEDKVFGQNAFSLVFW